VIAAALRSIEAELNALVERADDQHPIDPHEVRVAAIKVGAQAEMLEKGLVE
jgi:hypothetical protein